MFGDWASFDIANSPVMDRVKVFSGPWPQPPEEPEQPPEEPPPPEEPEQPEQPPQEEPMTDPKVIDLEYNERDFAYAKEKYGVAFRRADVPPGGKVYRLVELWEKTGQSLSLAKFWTRAATLWPRWTWPFIGPTRPIRPTPLLKSTAMTGIRISSTARPTPTAKSALAWAREPITA